MNKTCVIVTVMVIVFGLAVASHATLVDMNDGTIYDTDTQLSWLKDANYAMTSGYDADGMMTWDQAVVWAASLNSGSGYAGLTGWRLPTTIQPDSTCSGQSGYASYGDNCTGSEMGHLFYVALGNTSGSLTNTGPFNNLQLSCWSATTYLGDAAFAWDFNFNFGFQEINDKTTNFYSAWAVRSGARSTGSGLTISGSNVGIGISNPAQPLDVVGNVHVSGIVTAGSFSGGGSGLTNLNGANITAGTISGSALAAGAVEEAALAPGSVNSGALAVNAVTSVNISFYSHVVIVAPTGGDYDNPAAAMANYGDWCPSPSEDTPCLLKIMPGVYDVGILPVVMHSYIDIEGSGETVTKITGAISTSYPASAGTVQGDDDVEIRFLTVENTGAGTTTAALFNSSKSPSILHVTAGASSGSYRYGVYNSSSSPTMTNVRVNVSASTSGSANYGVYNSSSSPTMTNVRVNVTMSGGAGSDTWGVYNSSSSPTMTNVIVSASGGDNSYGVLNFNSSPTMTNVTATASGAASNYGVTNSGTGMVEIRDSAIKAEGGAINRSLDNYGAQAHMFVGITKLVGTVLNTSGTITCVGAYSASFVVLDATCE